MATQEALLRRLRRLIDDAGHGYSQSAPGFATDLTGLGPAAFSFGIQMGGDLIPTQVTIPVAGLSTGTAIAHALQVSVRAADPSLPNGSNSQYSNFSCTFDSREGYVLRSGSIGSQSMVAVTLPTSGDDITEPLKLGLHNGGYESPAHSDFSDEELLELVDNSISEQNNIGNISYWVVDTLPPEYETVIIYRTWSALLDVMMGRSAWWHPQKVSSEEAAPNVVFDNLFRLARWLKDKLDELQDELDSRIEVGKAIVFDRQLQAYVGDEAYKNPRNNPRILAVVSGETPTSVILEFDEILTLDVKHVYIGMREGAATVWDQTKFTEQGFLNPPSNQVAGLHEDATLVRSLRSTKNTMVKVEDLSPGTVYYFAIQIVDQNGNRHFSNSYGFEVPN